MKIKRLWTIFMSLIILLMIIHINVNSDNVTYNNSQETPLTRGQSAPDSKTKIIYHKRTNHPLVTPSRVRNYLHQMQTKTLSKLQSDRSLHGVPPIALNSKLNHLARIRAGQIAHRFSHYDREKRPYTTDDAAQARLPHGFRGSENIASAGLGNCVTLGDPKTYHNHDGSQMAEMVNDAMMNHDQLEANGHRKNILDQENTLVGIGTAYSSSKHEFYLAEDFGNHNSMSSEDVNQVLSNPIKRSEFRIILQMLKKDVKQVIRHSINFFKRLSRL